MVTTAKAGPPEVVAGFQPADNRREIHTTSGEHCGFYEVHAHNQDGPFTGEIVVYRKKDKPAANGQPRAWVDRQGTGAAESNGATNAEQEYVLAGTIAVTRLIRGDGMPPLFEASVRIKPTKDRKEAMGADNIPLELSTGALLHEDGSTNRGYQLARFTAENPQMDAWNMQLALARFRNPDAADRSGQSESNGASSGHAHFF